MNLCMESTSGRNSPNSVLEPESQLGSIASESISIVKEGQDVSTASLQNVAKLVLANPSNTTSVLQKVPTTSVMVVSAPGPLAFLKTLCSNSCGTSAPQFTLVNSTPLSVNVSNVSGKSIAVVGPAPIKVIRAVSNLNTNAQSKENSGEVSANKICTVSSSNGVAVDKNPTHNVFVKNTVISSEFISGLNEVVTPVQKLMPANSFLQNAMPSLTPSAAVNVANGQKQSTGIISNNKLKIINNIVIPAATNTVCSNNMSNNLNAVLTKTVPPQHFLPQKMMSNDTLNGASKKPTLMNNSNKPSTTKSVIGGGKVQKMYYSGNKGHVRTIPPSSNPMKKIGIKTLSPQLRGVSGQQSHHKSGTKLRNLSSQRSLKVVNKPNYIGKHAIQGQKIKSSHSAGKQKNLKPIPSSRNVFLNRTPQNTGVNYHQVLTANIIQSLTENGTTGRGYDYSSSYNGSRLYDSPKSVSSYPETPYLITPVKPQSNLDTLSFVCQAVLLDHNYNAAPPSEIANRNTPPTTISTQLNGSSVGLYYSPTSSTRNRLCLGGSTINTSSTLTSTSSNSMILSNNSPPLLRDDDAASDISCGSERKMETEGEETDTAPEAEAVTNEGYGDYVTRCLCGFLHDDGFMIECDKCKVWQHVKCVIKNLKKVPDDFLCEMCDSSKPVDRTKARTLQQQWLRENSERDAKLRKEARMQELKLKEPLSDSDSSDSEQVKPNVLNKNRLPTGRRKGEQGQKHGFRQRRDSSKTEIVKRTVKRKERKMSKKRAKTTSLKTQSDEDNQESWVNSSISQIPHLRQWIENYEEAVTNHYSPELRARILSIRINGVHSELSSQVNNDVHMCRVHTQPLTGLKHLISTVNLECDTPVIELRGKYMLSTQHRGGGSGANYGNTLGTRQHSQRPGPFLFFYRLHKDNTEVCVDTRTYGNDARFVRRSCTPNAELQHCIEKGVLHLYIVTVSKIDKNGEITIKHESHDLAAVGTTTIACACGNPSNCNINKTTLKKNGENTEKCNSVLRRRRGRRTVSSTSEQEQVISPPKIKEEPVSVSPVEVKIEPPELLKVEIEVKVEEPKIEENVLPVKEEETIDEPEPPKETIPLKTEDDIKSETLLLSPVNTDSIKKAPSDSEDKLDSPSKEVSASEKKKLSREERKIEAYMKAFERLERLELKKRDYQAKQAHRRESEPGPHFKDDDKLDSKIKRRRRKGRSRTISINSQTRRNRVNSADSSYATSGEECLLSPNSTTSRSNRPKDGESKDSDLLLTLASCEGSTRIHLRSPIRDVDCNSNSANSSPETPMSSACLLVAAAVEPLEPSFKFPKTKKGMMNEWLNKSPECIQLASSISPSSLTPHFNQTVENTFYESNSNGSFYANKTLATSPVANFCEVPTQSHGSAKKRWLRQAISEDRSESPSVSRPDSPPISDMVAPPKKRKLPRESLTCNNNLKPATFTPTTTEAVAASDENAPFIEHEDRVEIVTAGADGDSPSQVLIDDAALKERVAEMQQEIGACFRLPESRDAGKDVRTTLDPRLSRSMFNNSEHLVATVEKNLSIFGFEDDKQDNFQPTKRKLSITEYRQRKQLTVNEKTDELMNEDMSMLKSPEKIRRRSNSASSTASFVSTDEDETRSSELPTKVLSAFNSEPTELEKQRESVSLRLKKAFGLAIDEESNKTASNLESLLNNELNIIRENLPLKTSDCSSVVDCTFNVLSEGDKIENEKVDSMDTCEEESDTNILISESMDVVTNDEVKPEMFYTPDEDDGDKLESLLKKSDTSEEHPECINYVPPFNNPVYPNSSFTSFGSVIDDDVPYEGRNPSPPPELSTTNSFTSP